MKRIGGNIVGTLQIKNGFVKNEIGERIENWETLHELKGFLDYSTGEAGQQNFDAKVQQSTHVFICDYTALDSAVNSENSRMIINNLKYDVVFIDNPMGLNYQLEIYLNYTGGVANGG